MSLEPVKGVFELIRREGLIVIALVSMLYIIYWMTTGFSEADKLWRAEIAAWRESSDALSQRRLEAKIQLTQAVQQVEDRISRIEAVAVRMEQECKLLMTIDALEEVRKAKKP